MSGGIARFARKPAATVAAVEELKNDDSALEFGDYNGGNDASLGDFVGATVDFDGDGDERSAPSGGDDFGFMGGGVGDSNGGGGFNFMEDGGFHGGGGFEEGGNSMEVPVRRACHCLGYLILKLTVFFAQSNPTESR